MNLATKNERRVLTDEELREERYAYMRTTKSKTKKAYVRLYTNFGNINMELHTDIAPRAVHNFLLLSEKNYYKDVSFHRLIAGFMIQGGDPTGKGTGGESAWGKPFKDEFDSRLTHSERGVVSMANSGKNTNNSQFFITFDACNHLDNKHTIFGRVVGGMDVLDKMEKVRVGRGKNANKPQQEIKILDVTVFVNPFNEPWEREDPWKKKDTLPVYDPKDEELGSWFSAPQPVVQATGTGVGKYLPIPVTKTSKKKKSRIIHFSPFSYFFIFFYFILLIILILILII